MEKPQTHKRPWSQQNELILQAVLGRYILWKTAATILSQQRIKAKWRDIKKASKVAEGSPQKIQFHNPPSTRDDQSNKAIHHDLQGPLHHGTGDNSLPSMPKKSYMTHQHLFKKNLSAHPLILKHSIPPELPPMTDNVQEAGLVYTAKGLVLLLKQPDKSWGISASLYQAGEGAQQAAARASIEGIGFAPDGKVLWSVQMPHLDGTGDSALMRLV